MKHWVLILLRYFLAIVMFVYAYIKIVHVQFAIPDDVKSIPIKEADGVILAFSFLGYSAKFSFILGIAELIPAVLLLFRRTAFLGAVALLPILCFIFLINIFYDFIALMKIWTGILLTANLVILLFYRSRIRAIINFALSNRPPSNKE